MDSSLPPLTSDSLPEFSVVRADDDNGSCRISSTGHHRHYLVRVPEGCDFTLYMPAGQMAHCSTVDKSVLSHVYKITGIPMCDPCSEFLLQQRKVPQDHTCARLSSQPPELIPTESTITTMQTVVTGDDEEGTSSSSKKIRLSSLPAPPSPCCVYCYKCAI